MHSDPDKLLKKHQKLIQSDFRKVISHTQREKGEWFINSIMIEGCEAPFKFKRKTAYRTLNKGQRINLTYYPEIEKVAGLEFEVMRVVRIKLS
ncbi:hypothetical protein [Aliikangiella sp. G2MR2-5]|uniref:hypothetical protein n=1 Tax=Aliikangiella sp. G2MR2-5 TaxID=2788943 RepID=UPI0018ABB125|nr:hypothetical protein [Aliikangiella sp. G2MR2-5]